VSIEKANYCRFVAKKCFSVFLGNQVISVWLYFIAYATKRESFQVFALFSSILLIKLNLFVINFGRGM